eukprot:scaffold67284_cov66-Phaeocystis_antarctica.AAC.3
MRASVPPAHAPALQYYSKPQQVHRRVIVRGTAAVAGETRRRCRRRRARDARGAVGCCATARVRVRYDRPLHAHI